tara:strand:+ start:131 stop:1132 length:1002 start_codon:yes stop_codon:yes gene_type:complete
MNNKLIFSGVQPTGEIHIGNYLGAISQFVANQDKYDSIYSIVDLHAITVWQDPKTIQSQIHHVLSVFIASGLDYEKNIIFKQSSVPQHAELAWLLGCTARIGWLNRMTQFKDKAGKNRENASVGLYTYPILMAADILLYRATHVPVGDDQKQHLELARDIAHKFNVDYAVDFFPLPEPVMNKNTRIMSLRDGTKKMSKSDTSSYSRILMTDTNDDIKNKIKKSKTDSFKMPSDESSLVDRPEISNLINIFSAASGQSKNDVIKEFSEREISEFKSELTDVLIDLIEPISGEIKRLIIDQSFLNEVLQKGSERAKSISTMNISELHNLMGLKIL